MSREAGCAASILENLCQICGNLFLAAYLIVAHGGNGVGKNGIIVIFAGWN